MNNFILETESSIYRPVTIEDAEFIVQLRNLPHAKGFIHNTSFNVDAQKKWIADYLKRSNEYYWIIEDKQGVKRGTTSLYNYDEGLNQIESGRWITIPGTSSSSLSGAVLMKDFVFNVLNVSRVVCDTVITNKQVIKYHLFLGEKEFGRRKETAYTDSYEVVSFEETSENWPKHRKKLLKFCGIETDRKAFQIEPDGSLVEIDMHYEKYR